MSLQGLISGSECALPANPLSQVLKHAEGDRSLQQDRIAGPSSSRLHHLPGTSSSTANDRDIALAQQFFQNGSAGPAPELPVAFPHNFPQADMAHAMEISRANGVDLKDVWAVMQRTGGSQFHGMEEIKTPGAWAAEFGAAVPASVPGTSMQQPMACPDLQQSPYMRNNMYGSFSGMYGMNYPGTFSAEAFSTVDNTAVGKGKGKEIDFEAAFEQATASFTQSSGRVDEVADGVGRVGISPEVIDLTSAARQSEEFGNVMGGKSEELPWEGPIRLEDIANWEAKLNKLVSEDRDDLNYGEALQNAWESGIGDYNEFGEDVQKFDEQGLPIFGEYPFEQNNKYLGPSTSARSLLGEAKALLERNGSLSEATLMLEAVIQKGELGEGGYEAWTLLGETRNMDEREDVGMIALAEGVKRAEENGGAPSGMLSLAISYTNESYDRAAHTMLLRWVQARFPALQIPDETIQSISRSSWDSQNRITDLFLEITRQQYAQGTMDPEVQIGLGVLFYTKGDFDKAKDCFQVALSERPGDYLLWNRLGSCLSNGNKPEEALGVYREALTLRPTYTRAIYNVGVACLNIGAHKEAAEHFLSALAMQDPASVEKSDQLWFTLRRAFLSMNRQDLAKLAESRPSVDVFRKEGFDF